MISLQTVAMGLVIVFLDVPPTGYDWIADPIGWVLVLLGLAAAKEALPSYRGLSITAWVCLAVSVLVWPPSSVATIDDSLGWVFSLPTLAWCFLVCDSLHDALEWERKGTFFWLRNVFVVVALLPLAVYVAGADWLTVPAAVLAVAANVVLVFLLFTTPLDDRAAADLAEGTDEGTGAAAAAALRARNAAKAAGRSAADGARGVAQGAAEVAGSARDAAGRAGDRTWPWQTPEREAERRKEQRKDRGRRGGSGSQVTGAEVVAKVRSRSKARRSGRSS